MENLEDYKGKKVLIQVNNQEEYEALRPKINTIYKGWTSSSYANYMSDAKHGCFWIILDRDKMTRTIDDEVYDSIMQASEFIEPKVPEVINNYQIY